MIHTQSFFIREMLTLQWCSHFNLDHPIYHTWQTVMRTWNHYITPQSSTFIIWYLIFHIDLTWDFTDISRYQINCLDSLNSSSTLSDHLGNLGFIFLQGLDSTLSISLLKHQKTQFSIVYISPCPHIHYTRMNNNQCNAQLKTQWRAIELIISGMCKINLVKFYLLQIYCKP